MKKKQIQSLFKEFIVKRKNAQCQILIPLIELDELCEKIERQIFFNKIDETVGECSKH